MTSKEKIHKNNIIFNKILKKLKNFLKKVVL